MDSTFLSIIAIFSYHFIISPYIHSSIDNETCIHLIPKEHLTLLRRREPLLIQHQVGLSRPDQIEYLLTLKPKTIMGDHINRNKQIKPYRAILYNEYFKKLKGIV